MKVFQAALVAVGLPFTLPAQAQQGSPGAGAPPTAPASTPGRAYEAVVQGMMCKQQPSGRMDCEYKVGKSLRFIVAGVGQQDVIINFFKVDADEDFVASVAPLHGCVVVRPVGMRTDTTANVAFVSSQDGKVYRNWNTCFRPKK